MAAAGSALQQAAAAAVLPSISGLTKTTAAVVKHWQQPYAGMVPLHHATQRNKVDSTQPKQTQPKQT
jgi:hypothetical protein